MVPLSPTRHLRVEISGREESIACLIFIAALDDSDDKVVTSPILRMSLPDLCYLTMARLNILSPLGQLWGCNDSPSSTKIEEHCNPVSRLLAKNQGATYAWALYPYEHQSGALPDGVAVFHAVNLRLIQPQLNHSYRWNRSHFFAILQLPTRIIH